MAATQLRDRQRSQIVGPNTGKYPAIAADRRANGIADESVSHVDYPILSDGGRRRGHIYLEACQTAQRLEREPIYHLDYGRSEEPTSELQSLMRISYAVFCLKKQNTPHKKYK